MLFFPSQSDQRMDQQMVDLESDRKRNVDEEAPAIFKKAIRPVTLKFEDVVYSIKLETDGMSCLRKNTDKSDSEKVILKGVSGVVKPGEILAMLGPSGSGKTTLLTALGGRLGGKLSGSITYNNKPFSNSMKRNIGFVTQDDFLYPHLTVTETLVFTALLRLPNTLTKAEKTLQAEAVMTQLELTKCKDSLIGDEFLRGVSGGERRRVSIGQELLINPSMLFLDEPTSGLDSTTAQRIVKAVSVLAKGGRTIVMTIHQPSSRLFYMFHKVMLLSEGKALYFGPASEVMNYFSGIGHAPLVAMNPADFLLDLANGLTPDESNESKSEVKASLALAYKQNLDDNLKAELKDISCDDCNNHQTQDASSDVKKYDKWGTTWWQQFTVLFNRGVKERKHESFSGLRIGQVVAVALLCGLLWWQSSSLQDQTGLLFFISEFWGFFPLFQAIFTFPPERKMLEKERTSGTYRLSSYFLSRTLGDLPMELVLPTSFITITYWMAGFKYTPLNFFHTLFALLLLVMVAQGMGLALGAVVMDQQSATVLGSVLMLSFLLAGGYFVHYVPPFIAWIKYISISNYAYKLLLGSQFKGSDAFPCESDTSKICLARDFPNIKAVGLDGQMNAVVALLIMLVFYRLIAYIALMRIGVTKKVKVV